MSLLKIVKYGNPILRTRTKEVHKITSKIKKLIYNMVETMYAENGIGLAAPQVGESYKIFVIDISQDSEPVNPQVFINPRIIKKIGKTISYEGCLSVPNVYTDVRRYSYIIVKAKNENDKNFVLEAKDGSLLSRVIQHECNHLDGIIFIDHARDIADVQQQLINQNLPPIDMNYLLQEKEPDDEIKVIQKKTLKMLNIIFYELKKHISFTLFGALTGILIFALLQGVAKEISYTLYYVFHPIHVFFSAFVTVSM